MESNGLIISNITNSEDVFPLQGNLEKYAWAEDNNHFDIVFQLAQRYVSLNINKNNKWYDILTEYFDGLLNGMDDEMPFHNDSHSKTFACGTGTPYARFLSSPYAINTIRNKLREDTVAVVRYQMQSLLKESPIPHRKQPMDWKIAPYMIKPLRLVRPFNDGSTNMMIRVMFAYVVVIEFTNPTSIGKLTLFNPTMDFSAMRGAYNRHLETRINKKLGLVSNSL